MPVAISPVRWTVVDRSLLAVRPWLQQTVLMVLMIKIDEAWWSDYTQMNSCLQTVTSGNQVVVSSVARYHFSFDLMSTFRVTWTPLISFCGLLKPRTYTPVP
jgi:hypothetical protein